MFQRKEWIWSSEFTLGETFRSGFFIAGACAADFLSRALRLLGMTMMKRPTMRNNVAAEQNVSRSNLHSVETLESWTLKLKHTDDQLDSPGAGVSETTK